jgi:hypothetical protein
VPFFIRPNSGRISYIYNVVGGGILYRKIKIIRENLVLIKIEKECIIMGDVFCSFKNEERFGVVWNHGSTNLTAGRYNILNHPPSADRLQTLKTLNNISPRSHESLGDRESRRK